MPMINFDMIVKLAASMKNEYERYTPEQCILQEGIQLLRLSMGDYEGALKGFIQKNSQCHTIVVNSDLSDFAQDKVMIHELSHYKLGHTRKIRRGCLPDTSFAYRRDVTYKAHMENEANFLAAEYMLDTDETLEAIHQYDLGSAARILRTPLEFLDYKLRLLHHTKRLETYRDCFSIGSDCLLKMKADGIIID